MNEGREISQYHLHEARNISITINEHNINVTVDGAPVDRRIKDVEIKGNQVNIFSKLETACPETRLDSYSCFAERALKPSIDMGNL